MHFHLPKLEQEIFAVSFYRTLHSKQGRGGSKCGESMRNKNRRGGGGGGGGGGEGGIKQLKAEELTPVHNNHETLVPI